MGLVRPLRILGARIDRIAVLIDPVGMICRREQVDVVAVMAARVPAYAVQDFGAVQKISHVALKSCEVGVYGHRSPQAGLWVRHCPLYDCIADGRIAE